MELIAYILYLLASKSVFLLIFSIFGVIGAFGIVSFWLKEAVFSAPPEGHRRTMLGKVHRVVVSVILFGLSAAMVGILLFSIVNVIRPHYIDGQLMNAFGERTEGKVVRVEATSNLLNKQRVMRHYVIFKTAAGQNVDTYFETWDFNIYPSANSVSYPGQGETFGVLYLPSHPTAFLILTEDGSPYSKSRECGDILSELEAARIKVEFDPKDATYKREFEQATQKAVKAKCLGSAPGPSGSSDGDLPALTQ
jgi:hypothetical protein